MSTKMSMSVCRFKLNISLFKALNKFIYFPSFKIDLQWSHNIRRDSDWLLNLNNIGILKYLMFLLTAKMEKLVISYCVKYLRHHWFFYQRADCFLLLFVQTMLFCFWQMSITRTINFYVHKSEHSTECARCYVPHVCFLYSRSMGRYSW